MTEHPILFSTEMVKAILDGRKTQTRRVIRLSSDLWTHESVTHWTINENGLWNGFADGIDWPVLVNWKCPYGQPGDLLWVRETFCTPGEIPNPPLVDTGNYRKTPNGWASVYYRADGEYEDGGWRPSIHMPRWASRTSLEVTGVRVERVQDGKWGWPHREGYKEGVVPTHGGITHIQDKNGVFHLQDRLLFSRLWDSINAKRGYSWDFNPWVWVVEFKKL